jgi:hypothetical protein
MMRTASPFNALSTEAISFDKAKAGQSDGGGSFRLCLCASVKVFLMVMCSTGRFAQCPLFEVIDTNEKITCHFLEKRSQ